MVKDLPAHQETQVRSLGGEDSLEEETAAHSSILAWEFPWTEEPGGLQSMESQRVGYDCMTVTYTHRKKSTHVTLPPNSLPNSTLLGIFSSHKVPKVI